MLLYYITDRKQFGDANALVDRIAVAAAAGVDWIQLREKDLSTRELEDLAQQAKAAIAGTRTKLLVNARVDVAIACGLDGVHLTSGPNELPASEARTMFAAAGIEAPLIGVSCHTTGEALAAEAHGADFAVFAPVFGKGDVSGLGIEALREACTASSHRPLMPVMALGGITIDNAAACIRAGAAGIAAIRLFQGGDVTTAVRRLREQTISSSR